MTEQKRGAKVENPPANPPGGSDNSIREMTAKWHAQRFGEVQKPAQNQ